MYLKKEQKVGFYGEGYPEGVHFVEDVFNLTL